VVVAEPALLTHGRGLYRPCRARPADRSLVAEDRSAAGIRDQTGPGRAQPGRGFPPVTDQLRPGRRIGGSRTCPQWFPSRAHAMKTGAAIEREVSA
jgi:hypothetical protein